MIHGFILFKIFPFLFGACIGSFLNVIIYRLPRELDFVFKRSFCPNCRNNIPWYANIPIISFLFLKGKCKNCKMSISVRYPLNEILMGLFAVYSFPFDLNNQNIGLYLFYLTILGVFLCIFFIDLEFKIIPNSLNIYLGLIFLSFSIFFRPFHFWIVGSLIGFGFPLLVTWLFYLLRGKIGLGGGDIKLFGVLGIFLGPLGIVQNIFLSCFSGAIIGGGLILIKKLGKNAQIPFGPFIVLVALIQIFFPKFFKTYLIIF